MIVTVKIEKPTTVKVDAPVRFLVSFRHYFAQDFVADALFVHEWDADFYIEHLIKQRRYKPEQFKKEALSV